MAAIGRDAGGAAIGCVDGVCEVNCAQFIFELPR